MHGHVLKTLAAQRDCRICLLSHPFFKSVEFLFPFVEENYIFKRESCQRSIGEEHFNKAWPLEHIGDLIETLNQKNVDVITDLTQTETSARWLTFLKASEKIGVVYNSNRDKKIFSSNNCYVRYLHQTPQSRHHFIDLYIRSLGLTIPPLPEADQPENREKIILFQTLSSDQKKNWPPAYWKRLLDGVARELPSYQLRILASPSERSELETVFGLLPSNCQIVTTSMRETYELLQSAALLVTLDTAIKHLATWTKTPIIELALGSSNPNETGAYQSNAWIIQPTSGCSPCRHSARCHQPSFLCHASISPELVIQAVKSKLTTETDLSKICFSDFQNDQIKLVQQSLEGWWTLLALPKYQGEHDARRHPEPYSNHSEANR